MPLELTFIGVALIAATVVVHGVGSHYWVHYLTRQYLVDEGHWRKRASLVVLISTATFLLTLHIVEVMLWAAAYQIALPTGDLETFEKAVYFSLVTFTTLGYGDVTLSEHWRLLSGIEALNGILLVGWSTALMFAVVQRQWHAHERREDLKSERGGVRTVGPTE